MKLTIGRSFGGALALAAASVLVLGGCGKTEEKGPMEKAKDATVDAAKTVGTAAAAAGSTAAAAVDKAADATKEAADKAADATKKAAAGAAQATSTAVAPKK